MLSNVSPKAPDPEMRTALIDSAARLLTEDPRALTTRKLAQDVGTSTMAVYTYFRGMDELRHSVRKEGFDRLAARLAEVKETDDPVADVAALGGAYLSNALTNPHLYRFMFMEPPIDQDEDLGEATFENLVRGIERAVQSGRFDKTDPYELATQLWSMTHGVVTLHFAGLMTIDEVIDCITKMGRNLFVGFGDDPEAAEASLGSALAQFAGEIADARELLG